MTFPTAAVVIPHWSYDPSVDLQLGLICRAWLEVGIEAICVAESAPSPEGGASVARNINRGLRMAAWADVLIVAGNDVLPGRDATRERVRATIAEIDHRLRLTQRVAVGSPAVNGEPQIFRGACWLMSSVMLQRVGFLDEQFDGYFEDEDYALRLRHHPGTQWIEVPWSVDHLQGGGMSMRMLDSGALAQRNQERFVAKWGQQAVTVQEWIERQGPIPAR